MKTTIHAANGRGHANHGWLDSHHSFSFAHYYDPARMGFGLLRVLNDDVVEGGMGFGTHPHDNMEIISIPLKGNLAHRDSTGNEKVIHTGEVQIMSAGSGLTHSEYNASKTELVNFLQIWVLPKEKNIKPRYDQKVFDAAERQSQWQNVVASDNDKALWINQDAWFSLGEFNKGDKNTYDLYREGHGVYLFVLEGGVLLGDDKLGKRDAIAISETDSITLESLEDGTELLLLEIPMK
jgi:hypothetical protein